MSFSPLHGFAARLFAVCASLALLAACDCPTAAPHAPTSFSDHFAVVLFDKETEAKLGAFPLPRSSCAQAIRRAAALHARAVVFKFFFDQPQNPTDDLALAEAMTNLPVVLEACLDAREAHPNPLPARFSLSISTATAVSGKSGWLPLPAFTERAAGIGFVDFDSTNAPLLETYQGRTVKSLLLCCLEMAEGRPAEIHPGHDIAIGALDLPVDSLDRRPAKLPSRDDCPYIPFHRFLSGEIPPDAIRDKVVIIGYDGAKIHAIATPIGPVHAHRFFIYILQSLCDEFPGPPR